MGRFWPLSRSSFSLSASLDSCSSLALAFAILAASRSARACMTSLSSGRIKAGWRLRSSRSMPSFQRCTSRNWSHRSSRSRAEVVHYDAANDVCRDVILRMAQVGIFIHCRATCVTHHYSPGWINWYEVSSASRQPPPPRCAQPFEVAIVMVKGYLAK